MFKQHFPDPEPEGPLVGLPETGQPKDLRELFKTGWEATMNSYGVVLQDVPLQRAPYAARRARSDRIQACVTHFVTAMNGAGLEMCVCGK